MNKIIKLCQTLSMSHHEVATKLGEPVKAAKIMHLQRSALGQPARMHLDGNDESGAYVPGLSGVDPDSIGQDDPLGVLRQVRGLHRKAIKVINDFIQKAKANRDGPRPSLRMHPDFPDELRKATDQIGV